MKRLALILMLLVSLCSLQSHAQTWSEWFKQKKTQKKYLAKQIALLQVYIGYLKEGYAIADHGLTTINNIKNGDFNLHRDFFGYYDQVNPSISNSAKVADIVAFQIFIIREIGKVNRFCQNDPHFTPAEVTYVARVYSNLVFLTDASLSELLTIIHPNEVKMSDDERIKRVDGLYNDMQDKQAFVLAFSEDVHTIAAERQKEELESELLKKQYDIN